MLHVKVPLVSLRITETEIPTAIFRCSKVEILTALMIKSCRKCGVSSNWKKDEHLSVKSRGKQNYQNIQTFQTSIFRQACTKFYGSFCVSNKTILVFGISVWDVKMLHHLLAKPGGAKQNPVIHRLVVSKEHPS